MKKLFGKRRSSPKALSRGLNKGPASTRIHWDSESVTASNVGATFSPQRQRSLSQNPRVSGPKSEMPTLTQLTLDDRSFNRDKRSSKRRGNSSGSRNNRKSGLFNFTKPTPDTIPSNPGERLPSSKHKHLHEPESEWEDTYVSKELPDNVRGYVRWLEKQNPGFDAIPCTVIPCIHYPYGCPHHCARSH
jgi:hypothetical protein